MWPTSMCSPTRHPCRIWSRKCFFRPLHLVARNVVLPFVIFVVNPMFSSEVEVEEKLSYSFFSVLVRHSDMEMTFWFTFLRISQLQWRGSCHEVTVQSPCRMLTDIGL